MNSSFFLFSLVYGLIISKEKKILAMVQYSVMATSSHYLVKYFLFTFVWGFSCFKFSCSNICCSWLIFLPFAFHAVQVFVLSFIGFCLLYSWVCKLSSLQKKKKKKGKLSLTIPRYLFLFFWILAFTKPSTLDLGVLSSNTTFSMCILVN